MTRDGMPRAYLRIDPNIDQVFPELRLTFIGLMCAAGRQPMRGRFRDRRTVEGLLSKAFVRRCYDRGDVTDLPTGEVYVVGWDEWQEGDHTVADRMRRMRQKRRERRNAVTVPPSPASNDVTTDAVDMPPSLVDGDDVGEAPQPPTRGGRRSEGTSPRQVAAEMTRRAEQAERERKDRRRQRQLAYQDGRITDAQLDEMNDRDAPLEEIPTERGAAYAKAD